MLQDSARPGSPHRCIEHHLSEHEAVERHSIEDCDASIAANGICAAASALT